MLLRGAPSLAYLAALALSPPLAGHVRGVRGAIRGHIGLVALGAEQPRRALGGRAPALEAQPQELLRGGGTEHRAPRTAPGLLASADLAPRTRRFLCAAWMECGGRGRLHRHQDDSITCTHIGAIRCFGYLLERVGPRPLE
jgi:hypothetical protein